MSETITQGDRDDGKALARILGSLERAEFEVLLRYIERLRTEAEKRGALAMRERIAGGVEFWASFDWTDKSKLAGHIRSINPDTIGESHE